MANLQENAVWETGIYQLEQNDPVLGGPPDLAQEQGFDNVPHQLLANRTAWLKVQIEKLKQTLTDLTNGAPDALDTLNELAAALGDDPNFAATVLQQLATSGAPAGAVMPFAFTTPPTGWLKCNGAALNRSSYQELFSKIGTAFGAGNGSTTFNIPDMRGEFLRGWDNGRGVDAGRVFGSQQGDQIRSHRHNLYGDGDFDWTSNNRSGVSGNGSRVQGHSAYFGGNETRPRNVSLLFCIKY